MRQTRGRKQNSVNEINITNENLKVHERVNTMKGYRVRVQMVRALIGFYFLTVFYYLN
jgi:hypothetical protein